MSEQAADPVVRTSAGALRGRLEGAVAVFRGIPFAAPPVGPRRFQAPQRADSWDGVREADVFGPTPPQAFTGEFQLEFTQGGPVRHDPTDWLTLNVWTPDPGAGALPVMVWIYGGAFRMGSSSEPSYDGAALARSAGAVVVSFNYRLGVEGFAELDGAPANRGHLDQVAALRWVQDEIASFGGDPARVTVFGQSAGGSCVSSLLVMPSAAGTFTRAIAQSPVGLYVSPELARDISRELTAPLALKPTAEALAGVAPERLTEAVRILDRRMTSVDRWGMVAHTPAPLCPVVDGDILPTDPWTGVRRGDAREVTLVTGSTRDEYRLFLPLGGQAGAVTDDMATAALRTFGPGPDAESSMRAAFPGADPAQLLVTVTSDRLFRIPALHLAAAHTAGGGTSYLYDFRWPAPVAPDVLGACHGLDVPLVLGVLDRGLGEQFLGSPPPADALTLAAEMQAAWSRVAHSGDPGWPRFDAENVTTRVFDGIRGGVCPYPDETSRRLWAQHEIGVFDLQR
jgi:para-nitrobenzyl esterase